MVNSECGTNDIPFSKDCDKKWKIADEYNKHFWIEDESVTFDCKKRK